MANISDHLSDKSGILTQIVFAQSGSKGGDHLGNVIARAGDDGAKYEGWVNDNGTATALFKGNLNAGQKAAADQVGGIVTLTTQTDWLYKQTRATQHRQQQQGNSVGQNQTGSTGSDFVPQYE
jgi:hypothetical protein